MTAGKIITTQLEAVTVTRVSAVEQETVVVCDTISYSNRADRTRRYLSEQIPTIVGVVISRTAVKYVAFADSQLCSEAVCVLITCVSVVKGSAVEDKVVLRPEIARVIAVSERTDLNTCVAVIVCIDLIERVVVAANTEARQTVARIGYIKALHYPVAAAEPEALASLAEIEYGSGSRLGIGDHSDGFISGAVNSALYTNGRGKVVGALHYYDSLTGFNNLYCGIDIKRIIGTSIARRLAMRRNIKVLLICKLRIIVYRDLNGYRITVCQSLALSKVLIGIGGK